MRKSQLCPKNIPPRPAGPLLDSGFDGLLLVDKPAGPTSHDVVARIKRTFNIGKVGHGGTLDPGATGLLVILVGKGTSLSERIMNGDKRYQGEILLGTTTDTQDTDGEIVSTLPYDLVSEAALEREMTALLGDSYQTPPMVSAVKKNGVPLYKLARQGKTVERDPRLIHLYSFKLNNFEAPVASFEVTCSKGTYIRTLCHDIGQKLGCGACLRSLRRTRSGNLSVDDALPLDQILQMDAPDLRSKVIPVTRFLNTV